MVVPEPGRPDLAAAISNVARGWRQSASGELVGTARSGVSAALWTLDGAEREVSAEPNEAIHSLGLLMRRGWCSTFVDERRIFDGWAGAGAANLIRAGERPRGIMRGCRGMLHIYLSDPFLQEVAASEEAGAVELVSPRWRVDPVLRRVADAVLDEMRADAPFGRLRLEGLGLELAVHLLRSHSSLPPGRSAVSRPRGLLTPRQLARAVDLMEASLDRDLGLAEVAAAAGLSPPHFCRAFRRSTGLPPFRWLRQRRIARAKELLSDPRLSLAAVALEVGFSGQSQFTTAFRRETGTTPNVWRQGLP